MQPAPQSHSNMLLAIGLSMAILLVWQAIFDKPKPQQAEQQKQIEQFKVEANVPDVQKDGVALPATLQDSKKKEALASAPRVPIKTDRLQGSISLQGARFDALTLTEYKETPKGDSEPVTLLTTAAGDNPYFAEFGWLGMAANQFVPDKNTHWEASAKALVANEPLVLRWDNGHGLIFTRTITLDSHYMFRIEQRVENKSGAPITLYPYALLSRVYGDEKRHFYILHEGPLGVLDGVLEEPEYKELREDGNITYQGKSGWIGITDKYWLTALIPDQAHPIVAHFNHSGEQRYQVDYLGEAVEIGAGETRAVTSHFFAGAKKVALLDDYEARLGIPLFDRAVDFGMLYFLTRPIFTLLEFFHSWVGNFGLAILLLTVCIKLILFPLANKSYVAMHQMKQLMPKIQELKDRYKDDKLKLNQEIMALYKKEKVNPASGCLPILVQLPVFFSLYKVLFVTIEMRQAPFFGWIKDLSAPDPTTIWNLFGLIPWDPSAIPHFLQIGVWPLIMCVTMILQQRLNPKPTDPVQAQVMSMLPYLFLFLFATFPAGLVIYWAWNNTLSIIQQWTIIRWHGKKA